MGVVVSEDGTIEVIEVEMPAVTVRASPESGPYNIGTAVTLTAAASVSDGGIISYQWYRNSEDNANGTPIEGATAPQYTAPTGESGRTYYYVTATNTLNGKTAAAASNVLEVIINGLEITNVDVRVTTPVKGMLPDNLAYKEDTGYLAGAVAWTTGGSPVTGAFMGEVVYTATVTLTANMGFMFPANFTGKISGLPATVSNKSFSAVTLSYT